MWSNAVEPFKTAAQALAVAKHYDVLVLDGPARADRGTPEIAKAADLVVQPSGTSLADLRPTVLLFRELVQQRVDQSKMVVALCRVGLPAEERGLGPTSPKRAMRRCGARC